MASSLPQHRGGRLPRSKAMLERMLLLALAIALFATVIDTMISITAIVGLERSSLTRRRSNSLSHRMMTNDDDDGNNADGVVEDDQAAAAVRRRLAHGANQQERIIHKIIPHPLPNVFQFGSSTQLYHIIVSARCFLRDDEEEEEEEGVDQADNMAAPPARRRRAHLVLPALFDHVPAAIIRPPSQQQQQRQHGFVNDRAPPPSPGPPPTPVGMAFGDIFDVDRLKSVLRVVDGRDIENEEVPEIYVSEPPHASLAVHATIEFAHNNNGPRHVGDDKRGNKESQHHSSATEEAAQKLAGQWLYHSKSRLCTARIVNNSGTSSSSLPMLLPRLKDSSITDDLWAATREEVPHRWYRQLSRERLAGTPDPSSARRESVVLCPTQSRCLLRTRLWLPGEKKKSSQPNKQPRLTCDLTCRHGDSGSRATTTFIRNRPDLALWGDADVNVIDVADELIENASNRHFAAESSSAVAKAVQAAIIGRKVHGWENELDSFIPNRTLMQAPSETWDHMEHAMKYAEFCQATESECTMQVLSSPSSSDTSSSYIGGGGSSRWTVLSCSTQDAHGGAYSPGLYACFPWTRDCLERANEIANEAPLTGLWDHPQRVGEPITRRGVSSRSGTLFFGSVAHDDDLRRIFQNLIPAAPLARALARLVQHMNLTFSDDDDDVASSSSSSSSDVDDTNHSMEEEMWMPAHVPFDCVHLRRGDKVQECAQLALDTAKSARVCPPPLDVVIRRVSELARNRSVVVVSDDLHFATRVATGVDSTHPVRIRQEYDDGDDDDTWTRGRRRIIESFAERLLCAHATRFVGHADSTFTQSIVMWRIARNASFDFWPIF